MDHSLITYVQQNNNVFFLKNNRHFFVLFFILVNIRTDVMSRFNDEKFYNIGKVIDHLSTFTLDEFKTLFSS
jgi:hypothetical protein